MAKEPKKIGRPSKYSPEIATIICRRLAEGESLRSICKDDKLPCRSLVLEWAVTPNHPFVDQYARARDIQADCMADDIMDIADDGSNDWMERANKSGMVEIVADHENINRSRLRVDARKWIASKLKPKKYGERIQNEVTGSLTLADLVLQSQKKEET